jgi:hypothetical protein
VIKATFAFILTVCIGLVALAAIERITADGSMGREVVNVEIKE